MRHLNPEVRDTAESVTSRSHSSVAIQILLRHVA